MKNTINNIVRFFVVIARSSLFFERRGNLLKIKLNFLSLYKTKINSKLLFFTILILITLGCEDVIQVDLNSIDPRIVIEGEVANDGSMSKVRITKSTDYYNPGIYKTISGAEIVISDNEGNSGVLTEVGDGLYQTDLIVGKSGRTYNISVAAEGEKFIAESTMPVQIILDSLSLEIAPYPPGNKDEENKRYFLHLYFQDHPDIEDFCRFKIFNEGIQLGGFSIYSDKFTNGNYIDLRLRIEAKNNDIKIGNLLTVELISIDQFVFDYYLTANSVNASGSGGGGGGPSSTSVAPANPVTNWSNKALGLFSAHTVSTKSILVEE